jgi:hypothetical protein
MMRAANLPDFSETPRSPLSRRSHCRAPDCPRERVRGRAALTALAFIIALTACSKSKPPAPSRIQREAALQQVSNEHLAIAHFTAALRVALDKPPADLRAIDAAALPADLAQPWQQLLADPLNVEHRRQINAALTARGIIDLRL